MGTATMEGRQLDDSIQDENDKIERSTAAFEKFLDAVVIYIDHRRDDSAKTYSLRANAVDSFREMLIELRNVRL